jgi:hypothetical protein
VNAEPFEATERPHWMSDREWLTVGLICLAQLAEEVADVLHLKDQLELEIGLVGFGLFSRQVENWFIADFEHRGHVIGKDEARELANKFGEKMLDLRMEISQLN